MRDQQDKKNEGPGWRACYEIKGYLNLRVTVVWQCLLIPGREWMTEQRMNDTKILLSKPMGSTGAAYKNMNERLLKKQKWLKESCITKAHPPQPEWQLMKDIWDALNRHQANG